MEKQQILTELEYHIAQAAFHEEAIERLKIQLKLSTRTTLEDYLASGNSFDKLLGLGKLRVTRAVDDKPVCVLAFAKETGLVHSTDKPYGIYEPRELLVDLEEEIKPIPIL